MIGAAPAAPAAAPGALLLLSLGALVLYFVLLGLRQGYSMSLGALLRELADKTRGIRWVGGKIADAIESIDESVMNILGKGARIMEAGAAKFFHAAADLWNLMVDSIVQLAEDTWSAVQGLTDVAIPGAITDRLRPVELDFGKFRSAITRHVDAELARFARGIDRLQREVATDSRLAFRGIDALRADLKAQIARVQAYAGRVLAGRMSRAEQWVLGGTVAAIALATLTRYFPWWRCTNVRGFNRALCRSPLGSLDWIFALAALYAVALDPREIARQGQDAAQALEAILRHTALR